MSITRSSIASKAITSDSITATVGGSSPEPPPPPADTGVLLEDYSTESGTADSVAFYESLGIGGLNPSISIGDVPIEFIFTNKIVDDYIVTIGSPSPMFDVGDLNVIIASRVEVFEFNSADFSYQNVSLSSVYFDYLKSVENSWSTISIEII